LTVAFADPVFEAWSVRHFDIVVAIADQSGDLQLQRRLGDTGSAHTQHVGDQFLRHAQLIGRQAIQAQQQPTTQLLVDRVVAIADRRLRHLRNESLDHVAVPVRVGRPCESQPPP